MLPNITLYCVQIDERKVNRHLREITSYVPLGVKPNIGQMNKLLLNASILGAFPISERLSSIVGDELSVSSSLEVLTSDMSITDVSSSAEVVTSDISITDVSSCAEVVTSDISIAGVSSSAEVVTSDISIADVSSSAEVETSDISIAGVSSTNISIAEPEKKPKLPEEWVVLLQKPQPSPRPSHNVRNWRHNTQNNLNTEYSYRINKNLTYLSESWKIQIIAEKRNHLKAMVKKFENEWPVSGSEEQLRGKNRLSLEMKEEISHVLSVLQLHWAK